MNADLHTHSTASDGELSPLELLRNADLAGIELLAITDHDTLDGYRLAATAATRCRLIPGLELSTSWRTIGIHVVGLNTDPNNEVLLAGIKSQQQARLDRGERIAEKLGKAGFDDTLAGALQFAGDAILGRPHFARYLVASGQIKDIKTAFRKYLGQGKIGDVRETWAPLENVIQWITAAGGNAILAHPAKYKLTKLKLEALVGEFAALGGHGIEVISGRQTSALTDRLARLANRHGLLASVGSDFHQPGTHWAGLGQIDALPTTCEPVWGAW
jgi:hypothetical protein